MADAVNVPLKRTVAALVAAPVILAVCVAPIVALVSSSTGLEGEALMRAVEPRTPAPLTLGFGVIVLLCARLARADGLDLASIGWRRPTARDLLIGVVSAPVVALAATQLAYPAVQQLRPGFDPSVPGIALVPAMVMLLAAAVAEDTLYRGYALHQLGARFGRPAAIVITSLAYAFLAPGQGVPLVAFAFVLGLVLCGVRLMTGSLLPVVLVHATTALAPKLAALTMAS